MIKHSYTHFNLRLLPFFTDRLSDTLEHRNYEKLNWIKMKHINDYPIHKVMQKVVDLVSPYLVI